MFKDPLIFSELIANGVKNITSAKNIFEKKKFSNEIVYNMLLTGIENLVSGILLKTDIAIYNHQLGLMVGQLIDEKLLGDELKDEFEFLQKNISHTHGSETYTDEQVEKLLKVAQKISGIIQQKALL